MFTRTHIPLCALMLGLSLVLSAPAGAEQRIVREMVTFADHAHAHEAAHHPTSRCGICGSPRTESTQLVEVLGGRYEFEGVQQAYCPVCQVTTLNLENTPRTARFFKLLSRRLPVTRDNVVSTPTAFGLALKSTAQVPFIRAISGLRKQDGTVYFVVE